MFVKELKRMEKFPSTVNYDWNRCNEFSQYPGNADTLAFISNESLNDEELANVSEGSQLAIKKFDDHYCHYNLKNNNFDQF